MLRNSDTLESIVSEMIDILGAKRAAHAIEKSKTIIYDAASESSAYMLPMEHLLTLDVLCFEHAGAAPFHRWWGRQISKRANGSGIESQCLMVAGLMLSSAVGNVSALIKEAKAPESDGGHEITPRERNTIKTATRETRDACDNVDRALDDERDPTQTVHEFEGARERRGQGSAAE